MHDLPNPGSPTLLDLESILFELSESREEAAAVVNHLLQSGRVRLLRQATTLLPGGL
jgi:hypothetical protein